MSATPKDASVVSAVLLTLSSGTVNPVTPNDATIIDVAQQWQMMGTRATTAEIHGILNGVAEGRLTEIFGRIASAGEQLGLALTCSRDANGWLVSSGNEQSRAIAAKAFAEMTGYYALSAGLGLANITLRTLLLHPAAELVINAKYKKANGFPAFTDNRAAWLSLNSSLVDTLRRAAQEVKRPNVSSLINIVAELSGNGPWNSLVSRRDIDYHRWRPQNVPRAVQRQSPWEPSEDGERVIHVRSRPALTLPEYRDVVAEAEKGLSALSSTMKNWLMLFPESLREVGVSVFK